MKNNQIPRLCGIILSSLSHLPGRAKLSRDLRRVIGRVAPESLGRPAHFQAEALRLYHLPLEELGALADQRRQLAKGNDFDGRGNDIVTYIVDRNINYTNVCNVYCKFCAFYRVEKDDDPMSLRLMSWTKKSRRPSRLADRRC
ncbi:MAG: hypothetical protein WDM76_02835 [Limisphaerales bacterium]